MPDSARKKARFGAVLVILACLLLPSGLLALPVAVEQVKDSLSLKHSAFFLVDEGYTRSILEASSPLKQNAYSRLEDDLPLFSSGGLWLRFSLIKNNLALSSLQGENQHPLMLDLGPGAAGSRLYVAEKITINGEIKEWREFLPTQSGKFELPEPNLLPLTVYVRLNGIPSLWFNPELVRPEGQTSPLNLMLILQLALGLTLIVILVRGMSENEEWRFWAGAILACIMIPALFGHYGSEAQSIHFTSMPRLLAPGLAIMLMPHLGRYMLQSRSNKALDYTLITLSLLGVACALAPLIPSLGWSARLLPLAPLLLLPLIIISAFKARGGQSGAILYLLFNVFPFAGASLALLSLLTDFLPSLATLGPSLTIMGYLAGAVLIALAKPTDAAANSDFFPLNTFLDEGLFGNVPKHKGASVVFSKRDTQVAEAAPNTSGNAVAGAFASAMAEHPENNLLEDSANHLASGLAENSANNLAGSPTSGLAEKLAESPTSDLAANPASDLTNTPAGDLAESSASKVTKGRIENSAEQLYPDNGTLNLEAEKYPDASIMPEAEFTAAEVRMKKDKNLIYIKDAEEPGLLILKTTDSTPITGIAATGQQPTHNWEYSAINRLEHALRAPYQQLVTQLNDLRERQDVAAEYADALTYSLQGLGLMLDNLERVARGEPFAPEDSQTIFNLAQLIRHIHEELLPAAEARNLTLSWFVAPSLPAYFKGREQEISRAVKFLLQGTIEGAAAGAVQLTVRAGTGSYEGQIQFSLLESGMQPSHLQRPSGWLNKAWELAASSGGSFNIDFIPGKGMAITLALPLMPVLERSETKALADPLELPDGTALAEFAPGAEPEGAEEPISGLPSSLEEENEEDDVILLTNAIICPPVANSAAAENEQPLEQAEKTLDIMAVQPFTEAEETPETIANAKFFTPTKEALNILATQPLAQTQETPELQQVELQQVELQQVELQQVELQQVEQSKENKTVVEAASLHKETEYLPKKAGLFSQETVPESNQTQNNATATLANLADENNQTQNNAASVSSTKADETQVIIFKDDASANLPLALSKSSTSAAISPPRGASRIFQPAAKAAKPQSEEPREYIVIADLAASGRRLIARRLDGLPHKLLEARNAEEIIKNVTRHSVGLIIIDADMPEADVKIALEKVAEYNLEHAIAPTPSLSLLSHESQAERMMRFGSTESQIKSASRTQFRQTVLRLCPHPDANPNEMLPESPLLRSPIRPEQQSATQAEQASAQAVQGVQAEQKVNKSAETLTTGSNIINKKAERIPMLDLIVASLAEGAVANAMQSDKAEGAVANAMQSDKAEGAATSTNEAESATTSTDLSSAGAATSTKYSSTNETASAQLSGEYTKDAANLSSAATGSLPNLLAEPRSVKNPYPVSSMNESMERDMVPLIPGLLVVLEDALIDLAEARQKPDIEYVQDLATRMVGQGSTFGLNTLERMAGYVERAAAAGDVEAVRDFSDELLSLGQRYLASLQETHQDYLKKS